MAYFPFYVEVEGAHCLVIGGGIVALRKLEVMLPFGPIFHVVAPEIEEEILELAEKYPDQMVIHRRAFAEEDLEQAHFVVAASSDEELNRNISIICKARKLPVNVVDVKKECSFIVPAILHNDSFTVAVSSGGKSPAAASHLKRCVREAIPENYEFLVEDMGNCRDYVKEKIADQKIRGVIFQQLLELGLANGCCLTRDMVETVVEQYK